jgi:beta-glucanase (GH16 family)
MKKFNCILLIVVLGYTCFGAVLFFQIVHSRPLFYPTKGSWSLVWDDDFNAPTFDQTKWVKSDRSCDYSGYRKEIQSVNTENVLVKDGYLLLGTQSRVWMDPGNLYTTTRYTSGQISTVDKFDWTYGRIEFRAKMPMGEGLLSYASLRPADGRITQEILMMMMSGRNSFTVFMDNNWGTNIFRQSLEEDQSTRSLQDNSAGFHTFAIEWEPRIIRWYVDNQRIYQTSRNVPDRPLSLALGTTAENLFLYYNTPQSDGIMTPLPQYLIIDWVRVYQKR